MLRQFVYVLALIITSFSAIAQDDRLNSLNFDEEPLPEESTPYSAIGVGPVMNLFMPDVTDVNAKATALGLGNMNSPLLLFGVEFYTAIGIVPNVRIGFSWLTGSVASSGDVTLPNQSVVHRSVDYAVSTKTVHIDYALPLSQSFTVLPGIGLCWGTTQIDVRQNGSSVDWLNINRSEPSGDNTRLLQSALVALPRLSFEYVLTPFLAIRGQGSYAVQFSTSDWQANGYATVINMPDSISMNGFSAQLGVFLGLFN
jgi:hypothetical protein